MKTIFSNNSDLVHYFATNDQYFGASSNRNLYFEHNNIYSYGKHYLLAKKFNDNTIIINDRGYSNSTSKHIGHIIGATRHYNQFFVSNITLKDVYSKITKFCLKIPRARQNKGYYIKTIINSYEKLISFQSFASKNRKLFKERISFNNYNFENLIIDKRSKEFKEITNIYNNIINNLSNYEKDIEKINKKIAIANKIKEEKQIAKFRSYKIDYCRLKKDILRLDPKKEVLLATDLYVRSSQGIKMDIVTALKGITLLKKYLSFANKNGHDQSFITGQKIGVYTITSFNGKLLKIGCHRIDYKEIMLIDKQIKKRISVTLYNKFTN